MVVGGVEDVLMMVLFIGYLVIYLKLLIIKVGFDLDNFLEDWILFVLLDGDDLLKVWWDIWGVGQGINVVKLVGLVVVVVDWLEMEYLIVFQWMWDEICQEKIRWILG